MELSSLLRGYSGSNSYSLPEVRSLWIIRQNTSKYGARAWRVTQQPTDAAVHEAAAQYWSLLVTPSKQLPVTIVNAKTSKSKPRMLEILPLASQSLAAACQVPPLSVRAHSKVPKPADQIEPCRPRVLKGSRGSSCGLGVSRGTSRHRLTT